MVIQVLLQLIAQGEWIGKKMGANRGRGQHTIPVSCSSTPYPDIFFHCIQQYVHYIFKTTKFPASCMHFVFPPYLPRAWRKGGSLEYVLSFFDYCDSC